MFIPWEASFPEMGPCVQYKLIGNIPLAINLEYKGTSLSHWDFFCPVRRPDNAQSEPQRGWRH